MEQPWPGVTIVSALPGRERWDVGDLWRAPQYAAAVEQTLSRELWLRRVWANNVTGRLLVAYDPGAPRAAVRERVAAALNADPLDRDDWSSWRNEWPHGFLVSAEEAAVRRARARFALSGTVLAGLIAKRLIWGAGALAYSPLVIASALFGIVTGYRSFRRALTIALDGAAIPAVAVMQSVGIGLLIATESIEGVGALAAMHGGELLEARALAASRHTLLQIRPEERSNPVPDADERPSYNFNSPAELAAAIVYLATRHIGPPLAMLIAASPDAAPEAFKLATGITSDRAMHRGVLFRDPMAFARLSGRAGVVFDDIEANDDVIDGLRRIGIDPVVHVQKGRSDRDVIELIDDLHARRRRVVVAATSGGAALRAADLGISIYGRSDDDALAASDLILGNDGAEDLPFVLSLVRRTSQIHTQNRWLAGALGGGAALAAAAGRLSPNVAATVHNRLRLLLELNAARLVFTRNDRNRTGGAFGDSGTASPPS
jgi:cation transport ATPase